MAGSVVNVHAFKTDSNKIIRYIKVKSAFAYKFKRKDIAQTLGNNLAVKIASDRPIDPALLVIRFLVVST